MTQGTYLAGPNNSGKTAVLEALRCFFDDSAFHSDYINRTELTAKQKGFNRSEITVVFDLNDVIGKDRKKRMVDEYGDALEVQKAFSWGEATDTTNIEYIIGDNEPSFSYETMPKDIRELISAVSVSYIHPQEGKALLKQAQEKFKRRLFHNWGRHASVAELVKDTESQWQQLRETANSYLSSALSARLKEIWPNAEVVVELPPQIRDIVAVSDITFRSSQNLPRISLTSHGTGSQSVVLYQTHYVLDSDRSLHQGQYYPIWLLEEPESYLHADIAFELARLLSSDEWLGSIQMVTSTHSPIILAGSTQNPSLTSWVITKDGEIAEVCNVSEIDSDSVEKVGELMGDGNFGIYFEVGREGKKVFLEDYRKKTAEKFAEAGVPDPISLTGVGDVARHLQVLTPLGGVAGDCYFIIDHDKGTKDKEISRWIGKGSKVASKNGWTKLDCGGQCYLILLPKDCAVEHLFDEWLEVLQTSLDDLYDIHSRKLKKSTPTDLSRATSALRKTAPDDPDEGRSFLASQQDVKDRFWLRASDATMGQAHIEALQALLD